MAETDLADAAAEKLLAVDGVIQSTNALLQQLLWLLLSKGVLERAELIAAIDVCLIEGRNRGSPADRAAEEHLSRVRATIVGAGEAS
jgi:hypothetical protein